MRRAPIVLVSTAAGLAAVLGYHTSASAGGLGGTAGGTPTTGGAAPAGDTSALGTRNAVGLMSQDIWGTLAVSATATGSRISKVEVASMNDMGNPISEAIDQRAIPKLEQEAMAAQSAAIDTVSGATYTSKAFTSSLQSALSKLGLGAGGTTPPPSSTTTTTEPPTTTTTEPPTTTTTTTQVRSTPTTAASRTVVGQTATDVFGSLAVSVTASGSRITNVTLASLNSNGNTISEAIDQGATPKLEQEALAAQSSQINTISGATYTSNAFISSLQSALSQLGL